MTPKITLKAAATSLAKIPVVKEGRISSPKKKKKVAAPLPATSNVRKPPFTNFLRKKSAAVGSVRTNSTKTR